MAGGRFETTPTKSSYDVIIIGGAIMGSAAAWFLAENPDFSGDVLVVERDPSFEFASTTHTNSCIRQQFSTELNVRISQFTAAFIRNFRERMGGDTRIPEITLQSFGYLYLADTEDFANTLRKNQKVQVAAGAATELLTANDIASRYPFYSVDDIVLGSINRVDEGYWDGATVFYWWQRQARERGVEYISNEVVDIALTPTGTQVKSVTLATGEVIACGHVVNASGPRAARTSKMVGVELPVEPRKRYTWIFKAEKPLDQVLPLTIDPSGVHVRENGGGTYMCGGHSDIDPAAAFDDFSMDHTLWENHIWPAIATRIPQFEAVRVQREWVGHYAMNTFDQNAITGPHPEIGNFLFMNGFSGHGLQQSPAMGRGISEWVTYGEYRSLDLEPFHFGRLLSGQPSIEQAVI